MRTSFNTNNKMTMLSEMRNDSIFQILEYDDLEGSDDLNLSIYLS
ncbi:AIM24 family protein, partial [Clostridium perfringens]|nr:AIM24 family protein [Clostridium perfringens]